MAKQPMPKELMEFKATYGRKPDGSLDKRDIRCECGGEVACGGTVHALADLGFGMVGGKLRIKTRYTKTVIGYSGWCMACGREGNFILPEYHVMVKKGKGA